MVTLGIKWLLSLLWNSRKQQYDVFIQRIDTALVVRNIKKKRSDTEIQMGKDEKDSHILASLSGNLPSISK